MNRAFLSLYFIIVASVIVIGWGLDTLWNQFSPNQPVTAEVRAILHLWEREIATQPNEEHLAKLSQELSLDIQLISLSDLANSSGARKLHDGEILSVSADEKFIWYKRIGQTTKVLVLTMVIQGAKPSLLYSLLLAIFYSGIAIVIYLWIWPLSRDVKKLEAQTRTLGREAVPESIRITSRSPVYGLAQAFNHMTHRLRSLINSYKEMTNAVSHELRTPLARMKFALAMLETQPFSEKSLQQLNGIKQDVSEMESLIASLLQYAGFEQQSQQLVQRQGHMVEMLDAIRMRFSHDNPRHLVLEVRDHTYNAAFTCEWKLMETVLHNVINNAARYAQSKILIELNQKSDEFCIAIEDDGPGIPIDERQRAFESFVRLYHEGLPATTATGGFGLGLAIVKRIMEWHKGDARFVEPQELAGARAEIIWPK